ncbi:MAG: PadR family transcriptional regulator [Candidatus Omnitrophota bacterium]
MIEQELLFLGLLKQGPKHGYEIKVQVKEILSLLAGVRLKSIYYPLKVLEQKGLIDKKIRKVGKRPKRIVYSLTYRGKKRFEKLLNKSFLELKRPQFNLDLSLYFLDYLSPASARRRLLARLHILNKISSGMNRVFSDKIEGNSPSSRIIRHNFKMLQAESEFLFGLIKDFHP